MACKVPFRTHSGPQNMFAEHGNLIPNSWAQHVEAHWFCLGSHLTGGQRIKAADWVERHWLQLSQTNPSLTHRRINRSAVPLLMQSLARLLPMLHGTAESMRLRHQVIASCSTSNRRLFPNIHKSILPVKRCLSNFDRRESKYQKSNGTTAGLSTSKSL
jgi:hypothetical protein